jgi:hypothetical protein
MAVRKHLGWVLVTGSALLVTGLTGLVSPAALKAEQAAAPSTSAQSAAADKPEVTFTKDIAPILQRSCQNCHRPGQVAPMSLLTYEEARPWARSMKARTAIRDKAGAMPPWYIEKNIGIQHYKNDPSLSDEEVAKIAKWADTAHVPERSLVARRRTRPDRREPRDHRQGQLARLVGRVPADKTPDH